MRRLGKNSIQEGSGLKKVAGELTERNGDLCAGAGAHSRSLVCPRFPVKTVASVDLMRLSLRRAAYVAAGRAVT